MTEQYFKPFRDQIIGCDQYFDSPYGKQKILYADWTASGRMYKPIEDIFTNEIAPFVANTHTETNVTGSSMTQAYHKAKEIIKNHVHAHKSDILISSNSGMTGVVNKLQRIIGIKLHEKFSASFTISDEDRPIVFVTHMEHHSNQTSWLETIAQVVVINADEEGLVDLGHFAELLETYKHKQLKIAALTSCSNVTGVFTPYHKMSGMVHRYGGYCFVDFACSAPYIDINMHPENKDEYLDAIYFSPHKFLGGPSSSGILIFNQKLYNNKVPDNPGGGTVDWTNPWGEHKYYEEIEAREDGGTPAFLQTIRVALSIQLKEKMGTKNILTREHEMLNIIWEAFDKHQNIKILATNQRNRLGVISFYIDNLHYNLGVKLLNDKFGIQVRGGCSCAGTYGHYLLQVSHEYSKKVTDEINHGILMNKPGWIRMSIHPTMSNDDLNKIIDGICQLAMHHQDWGKDYMYCAQSNDFKHITAPEVEASIVDEWFSHELI